MYGSAAAHACCTASPAFPHPHALGAIIGPLSWISGVHDEVSVIKQFDLINKCKHRAFPFFKFKNLKYDPRCMAQQLPMHAVQLDLYSLSSCIEL